jgi:hypothetical protein
MSELLDLVLHAPGGLDRWRKFNQVRATIVAGGGLRARLPDVIASHSREQGFYFGDDFLLRRHDYQLEIAGGIPVAQYVHDIVEADGFRLTVAIDRGCQ